MDAERDSPKNEEGNDDDECDPVNTVLLERTATGNLENGIPASTSASDWKAESLKSISLTIIPQKSSKVALSGWIWLLCLFSYLETSGTFVSSVMLGKGPILLIGILFYVGMIGLLSPIFQVIAAVGLVLHAKWPGNGLGNPYRYRFFFRNAHEWLSTY